MSDTTPADPTTTPETPEPIPRVSPVAMASMRAAGMFTTRWLARLFTFGEAIMPGNKKPFGGNAHAIFMSGPELGPELAASAIGAPVNYAVRAEDNWRCHWRPEGAMLRGLHPEVLGGFIENAWTDAYGVMGVVAIFAERVNADLSALERDGDLGFAAVCLVQDTTAEVEVTPWGLLVGHVKSARAISLDFNSLAISPGSRILRRLAPDEDPSEQTVIPPDPRAVPLPPGARRRSLVTSTIDSGGGSVGTPAITPNAVTAAAASATSAAGYGNSSGTFTDIISVSLTTTGKRVAIVAGGNFLIENTSGAPQKCTMAYRLVRDSTVLRTLGRALALGAIGAAGGADSEIFAAPLVYTDPAPTAGSHTYKLQAAAITSNTTITGDAFDISAEEAKTSS